MSGKFTPGPWQLGCEMGPWTTDSEQGSHCSWSIGKGRNVIAIAVTHADYDDPEFLANARLIAAAPDLLEALQELVGALDSCVELTPDLIKKAETAIAKATNA